MPQLKTNHTMSVMNLFGENNLPGENNMAQNTASWNVNQTDDKKTEPNESVTTEIATPYNPKTAKDKKTNPGKDDATENATLGDDSAVGDTTTKLSKMAKTRKHSPTSEMVLNSTKSLKMREGASAGAIYKHMEDNYPVKWMSYSILYFGDAVKKGSLVKTGTTEESRFKLQKMDNAVKKTLDPKKVLKQDEIEKKIKMTENAKKTTAREPKAVLKKKKIGDVKKMGRDLKDGKKGNKPVGKPMKQ